MWEETLDQWSPHQGTCLHHHPLRPQPGAMGHSHTARAPQHGAGPLGDVHASEPGLGTPAP